METIVTAFEKWIAEADIDTLPLILGEIERLKGQVWVKILRVGTLHIQSPSMDGQLLTIPQVANRLSVPESRAYELARQHKLPSVRIGKYVRVPLSKLAEYERSLSGDKK